MFNGDSNIYPADDSDSSIRYFNPDSIDEVSLKYKQITSGEEGSPCDESDFLYTIDILTTDEGSSEEESETYEANKTPEDNYFSFTKPLLRDKIMNFSLSITDGLNNCEEQSGSLTFIPDNYAPDIDIPITDWTYSLSGDNNDNYIQTIYFKIFEEHSGLYFNVENGTRIEWYDDSDCVEGSDTIGINSKSNPYYFWNRSRERGTDIPKTKLFLVDRVGNPTAYDITEYLTPVIGKSQIDTNLYNEESRIGVEISYEKGFPYKLKYDVKFPDGFSLDQGLIESLSLLIGGYSSNQDDSVPEIEYLIYAFDNETDYSSKISDEGVNGFHINGELPLEIKNQGLTFYNNESLTLRLKTKLRNISEEEFYPDNPISFIYDNYPVEPNNNDITLKISSDDKNIFYNSSILKENNPIPIYFRSECRVSIDNSLFETPDDSTPKYYYDLNHDLLGLQNKAEGEITNSILITDDSSEINLIETDSNGNNIITPLPFNIVNDDNIISFPEDPFFSLCDSNKNEISSISSSIPKYLKINIEEFNTWANQDESGIASFFLDFDSLEKYSTTITELEEAFESAAPEEKYLYIDLNIGFPSEGGHTIKISVKDNAGNLCDYEINFTFDTTIISFPEQLSNDGKNIFHVKDDENYPLVDYSFDNDSRELKVTVYKTVGEDQGLWSSDITDSQNTMSLILKEKFTGYPVDHSFADGYARDSNSDRFSFTIYISDDYDLEDYSNKSVSTTLELSDHAGNVNTQNMQLYMPVDYKSDATWSEYLKPVSDAWEDNGCIFNWTSTGNEPFKLYKETNENEIEQVYPKSGNFSDDGLGIS